MRTIETTAVIEPDGKLVLQLPPDIPSGQRRVVLVIDQNLLVVLLPLENVDLEPLSLIRNPQFQAIIERSRLRDETEGRLSSEEVRRMFAAEK